jgi:hypothetical protein
MVIFVDNEVAIEYRNEKLSQLADIFKAFATVRAVAQSAA